MPELNKANSLQIVYTKPTPPYVGADQAAIEALTGIEIGSIAFALAEDTFGRLTSTGWEWGASGSFVESVTGDGVDNTDPQNPVISYAPPSEYIEDTINNGTTDKAPSENAVFDALALKEDIANKATDFSTVNNTLYPSVQATKNYVDTLAAGIKWKTPVKVATTTPGTSLASDFENGDTIDGVVLVTGDRILIKNQAGSAEENGIYTVNASGAPTRATDADTGSELVSAAVFVEQGTANADKAFVCTDNAITLGVTSITFVAFATVVGALIASNNLSDLTNPGDGRTNLGGTTVGQNIFTGTNPSAVCFIRINADNTITFRSASEILSDLGISTGIFTPYTNANDVFRCDAPGGVSLWTGLISGTPSGTSVVVGAPTSGTEAVLVPTSTSQLGKMRLYNSTRNNHALIQNYNVGTNTFTLVSTVPGDWANGDSLTVVSTTVSGGGVNWVDIEITEAALLGKSVLHCLITLQSATIAGNSFAFHPTETFGASKILPKNVVEASIADGYAANLKLTSNLLTIGWAGTPAFIRLRVFGYYS